MVHESKNAGEDLANTPAERAAAQAAGESEANKAKLADAALFDEAEEIVIENSAGAQPQIVLVGAGLVGALAAVVLLRKGYKVHIYERYPDIRSIPAAGRSINLSVTSRGLRAVEALGGNLYERVLGLATKIMGRIIHMPDGSVVFQRYGKDDTECNYSISRIELNKLLINMAAEEGGEFHFDHNLSDTSDFNTPGLVGCMLHFTQGPPNQPDQLKRLRIKCNCPVIGCDGGGSRVRYALQKNGLTTFTEDLLSAGYKEVLFPNPGENHFGAKGEGGGEPCHGAYGLHIWPRGNHMLMALANKDGSFTGTFYTDNYGPENSFEVMSDTTEGRKTCVAFCDQYYKGAVPLVGGMDTMVDQLTKNPTGLLGTVRCTTWAIQGKTVLIGDAAHAMVPFFGQGCNCGFEDTLWLSRLLDKHCGENGRCTVDKCTGENYAACFAALEAERKPNGHAICDMALENFKEMADKSGEVKFQAMKKVENKLENTFPQKFRSRYAMVCYGGEGNVSYKNAKALGLVQSSILERICNGVENMDPNTIADKVDMVEAEKLIDDELAPKLQEFNMDLSTVKHLKHVM